MDDDPFSGWGLRPVELTDRAGPNRYFASLAEPLSDYTFSQLFTWRNSLRHPVEGNPRPPVRLRQRHRRPDPAHAPIGDTGGDRALSAAFELMDDYNAMHGVPEPHPR